MNNKAHFSQGLLLFHLSTPIPFAIGTLKVKEIINYEPLTSIPKSHKEVMGAISVRGRTIPVIDMSSAIGYRSPSNDELKKSFIIVTDCQRKEVGFLVFGIDKIIECNWKEILPPSNTLGNKAYLTGITRHNDRLIQVLDV